MHSGQKPGQKICYNSFILDFQKALKNGDVNEASEVFKETFKYPIRGENEDNVGFVDCLINLHSTP